MADPVAKVKGGGLGILAAIVWTGGLDIADIVHDDILIIALALDKKHLDTMRGACVRNPLAALLGRVGGIEDADNAAGTEPGQHIGHSGLGSGAALTLAFGIVGVEEVSRRLWRIVTPIVADVKGCSRDGEPLEIALSCLHQPCQLSYEAKARLQAGGFESE